MEARVARLDERLVGMGRTLEKISDQMETASEGRRRIHEAQEKAAREMLNFDHRLETLETTVNKLGPTSEEHARLLEQVRGAGTLGRWLWRIGGFLLSAAAGFGAAWTFLTGRPPP